MVFPSPAPFMMMASADYSPYPLHTAADSTPLRRHHRSESSSASRSENRPTSPNHTAKPKAVGRVDSGFEDAFETSSITFTEDVERRLALRQFLRRRDGAEESGSGNEEDGEDDEGELGLRAVDSIDIIIGRASVWEDRENRVRRNGRSRSSRMRKWRKWIRKLVGSRLEGPDKLLKVSG